MKTILLNKYFIKKNILLLDAALLFVLGFGQSVNSFIGYYYNIGLYKILFSNRFAAIGIFETNFLLGLFSLVLFRCWLKGGNLIFYYTIAALIHLLICTSNVIFWSDTFVVNNAVYTGRIATVLHLIILIVYISIIIHSLKTKKATNP